MKQIVDHINNNAKSMRFVQIAEPHDNHRKDDRRFGFDFFKTVYASIEN